MAHLPDEIWTQILQAGVRKGVFDHRDLCSLSIVCRSLRRLSSLQSLWKPLYEQDFPQALPQGAVTSSQVHGASLNFKTTYRGRFEKVKAAKLAAHKRQVLRVQSQGAVLEKECKDLEKLIRSERERLSAVLLEVRGLERARRASIALRLWQPQVVRSMQQQVVEQQPVDLQARQQSLEMEVKICRERITRSDRSITQKRSLIERIKKELEFLTYNPVQDLHRSNHVEGISLDMPKKKIKIKETKSGSCSTESSSNMFVK